MSHNTTQELELKIQIITNSDGLISIYFYVLIYQYKYRERSRYSCLIQNHICCENLTLAITGPMISLRNGVLLKLDMSLSIRLYVLNIFRQTGDNS